jgi:ribulose-5-phosphate 4-epimerase/fuculose-1-phosphate aldolase
MTTDLDAHSTDRRPFERLAAAARRVAAFKLSLCSSGNLSCRLDARQMLIKASGAWMSDLTEEKVALCRIEDGASLNGLKPSVEIGFHRGILARRPDINVVLHFQSPCATTLCCREPRVTNFNVTSEIPFYVGSVAWVSYILPGSKALAEAVIEALSGHNLAMLANHGQVTVGKDYEQAIQRAVFFEMACAILVRNSNAIRPLTPEAAAELGALGAGKGFGV